MLDSTASASATVNKRNTVLKASPVVRRPVVIAGHRTNVSVENALLWCGKS